jgi:hypothetical protein
VIRNIVLVIRNVVLMIHNDAVVLSGAVPMLYYAVSASVLSGVVWGEEEGRLAEGACDCEGGCLCVENVLHWCVC